MTAASSLYDSLLARLGPEGIGVERGTGKPFGSYPLEACCWLTHADGADGFSAPQGQQKPNAAPRILDQSVGLTVRVEGSSPISGADYGDQHDAVKAIVDRVICAIHAWARGDRASYEIGRGGWITPEKAENPVGAVFVFGLTIADRVVDTAFGTVTGLPWTTQKTILIDGVEAEFDAPA